MGSGRAGAGGRIGLARHDPESLRPGSTKARARLPAAARLAGGPLPGRLPSPGDARRAHDPTLLVRREAPRLRPLGIRFFLSCGTTHDRVTAAATRRFARLLSALRLRHRLWLRPGGHDGAFWRSQLIPALEYALRR